MTTSTSTCSPRWPSAWCTSSTGTVGWCSPTTEHGVKVKLKEQGLLFPAESEKRGGFLYQLPIEDRPRVLRITNFLSV